MTDDITARAVCAILLLARVEAPSGLALRLLAALLPHAERDEVISDVRAEHTLRRARSGRVRAGLWLWRQVLGSVPALLRRGWWRGWSGFEPEANRLRTGGPMLETWIMDSRYAVRRLVKRPSYALLAVLTLALGVGGTAAAFGIVRELLLSPLPIAAEEEVVLWWQAGNWREAELVHLQRVGVPGFQQIAAYGVEDVRLAGDGALRVIPAVRTSAELFDVLGVRPRIGPGFTRGDDEPGAEPKVVLSHSLWLDLGADAGIVGRSIELNGVARTVAGVMPAGFWFPAPDARAWVTHGFNPSGQSGWYRVVGRLQPGQSPGEVEAALGAITTSLGEQFQYAEAWDNTRNAELTPIRESILGPARPTLVATLAAMAVILLIACANVAALMLGQMETRATELSVRNALGAGRGRLTRQLMAEGLILGAAAGVAGAAFAAVSFRLLLAALPLGALAERASLDWGVFWFSLGLAITTALVIALIPVFAVMRADLRSALTGGRTGGIAGRGGRVERGLVVAEVALAVIIAAGAAVLIRSVANLRAVDPGLDPRNVAIVDVIAPAEVTNAERTRVVRELVEALSGTPGVEHVGATQRLPLRGGGHNWGITIEGRPDVSGTTTSFRIVTQDYFGALGARLLRGRLFDTTDRAGTEAVVVINEALAREYFPGEDPVGRRLSEFGEFARIVGVIADMHETNLTDEPAPARYVLYDQSPYAAPENALVVRMSPQRNALAALPELRETITRAAPAVGIQDATTMERVIGQALGPANQLMLLLSLLAGLALLLGGIGVYGVVSHFVNRRRRDWGIRMALGFRPGQVIGRIVGGGALLVALGIVIGLAGALVLTRLLDAFVYGVGTADPAALLAAALTLLTIGVLGSFVPARRASRVDPARVLREQ